MRPTLTRLRGWTPDALTDCAGALDAVSRDHLAAVRAAHVRTHDTDWTGVAAVAALDRVEREFRSATEFSAALDDVATALRTAAATIVAARSTALAVAGDAADVFGLRVSDSGRVTALAAPWLAAVPATAVVGAALAVLARMQDARLSAALDAVDEADRAAADALRRGGVGPVSEPALPANEAVPEANTSYWTRLTEEERREVIAAHPGWIGNRDGIPAAARDAANRAQLAADRHGLGQRLEELRAAGRYQESFGAAGSWARAEIGAVRARLDEIDAVSRAIADPDRRLLVYRGGVEVRAAVAIGDVDNADHVAAFTPGVNSTVRDDLARYAESMEGLRGDATRQLVAADRADETVAAVVWMDYRAPQIDPGDPVGSVRDAIVDLGGAKAARAGAQALASFYRGLAASRTDPMHLTAVGHSYGSTTTGMALRRGDTGVDDAVFLGSPGLGTDTVADLGLAPGHVYVAEAHGDRVADLAAYGTDPNRLSGVTNLSTVAAEVDGESYSGATGHSDYLSAGSTSRHNVAAVVAGLPEHTVEGTDRGVADRVPGSPLGDLRERVFGGGR
ncbi:alpha/beta hydrolase [Rhodococcus sp. NPDC004095]